MNNLTFRQCPVGSVPYLIREDDTIFQIAKQYNVTAESIINANPYLNFNNLKTGDQICIPLEIQMYPVCRTTNYYVVTPTDSFMSIANQFNITFDQLYYSNYGIDPNDLYVDQILCIPVTPPQYEIRINTIDNALLLLMNEELIKTYPILNNAIENIPKGIFIVLNKQLVTGIEQGSRYLGLSQAGFGIHGVTIPQFLINTQPSNNIILPDEQIADLFNRVTVGTTVSIL